MQLVNLHPDRVAALLAVPAIQQLLNQVDSLRADVHALHPLSPEAEARVMQKFRLDWNYHSNAIEGNSLTYGETTALLMEGAVAHGKPMKDHEDIKGHNAALNMLLDLIRQKEELRQHDVRNLHRLMLGQPYYTAAETPDGQPTQKLITPGEYKDMPNQVRTATGEMHYYAGVEETPILMTELFDWLTGNQENLHPLILSTLFHHAFVSIHPFSDGNGRMTRLISNLLLMQAGFPPLIVKQQDRTEYYGSLRQADAGEPVRFVEFLGQNLLRSLDIQLRGAKGEDIFEPDDLDREIDLLTRSFAEGELSLQKLRSHEAIVAVFRQDIIPLLTHLLTRCQKLADFFMKTSAWIARLWQHEDSDYIEELGGTRIMTEMETEEILAAVFRKVDPGKNLTEYYGLVTTGYYEGQSLIFTYDWGDFKGLAGKPFSVNQKLQLDFDRTTYSLKVLGHQTTIVSRLYHQHLSPDDIETLTTAFLRPVLDEIKQKTGRS